jgi:hypothetical protein
MSFAKLLCYHFFESHQWHQTLGLLTKNQEYSCIIFLDLLCQTQGCELPRAYGLNGQIWHDAERQATKALIVASPAESRLGKHQLINELLRLRQHVFDHMHYKEHLSSGLRRELIGSHGPGWNLELVGLALKRVFVLMTVGMQVLKNHMVHFNETKISREYQELGGGI